MSKSLPSQENPLELLLYSFAEVISPFFRSLNFTANGLTTIANLGAALALYAAYRGQMIIFVAGMTIKYLFDCADGYYARRYNMVSEWGDLYDHLSDLSFSVLLVLLLLRYYQFQKWAHPYRGYFVAVFLALLLATWIHASCQEVLYAKRTGKPTSATMSIFRDTSPKEPERLIHVTKWVGSPVVTVIFVTLIVVFALQRSSE
jgi:phosphatidylglycerophosphate synthase